MCGFIKSKCADTYGFTLIELAIVLAVIAIVGAIILPSFLSTTDKARLRADVQSVRVIQNAADLYNAERGTSLKRQNIDDDIKLLESDGYLSANGSVLQTADASWAYDTDGLIKVNISGCSDDVKRIARGLDSQERLLIIGAGLGE